MVLSVNKPVTGYAVFNKPLILPRKASTVDDTPKNDTFEVEQALKRAVPLTPVSYVDELDLNAPLVSFLAKPEGQWGKIVAQYTAGGTFWGGVCGALLALGPILSTEYEKDSRTVVAVIAVIGFTTTVGIFLGNLLGSATADEVAKDQQWVNNNMTEMMNLTSPHTLLKEANKVLQEDTGESFTQRLANRQDRKPMQVT